MTVLPIPYSGLKAIRDVVHRLVNFIDEWNPDLVLFFATGSLPYVLPAINKLGLIKGETLLDRSMFHMFPGLAWSGKIEGQSSEEYFISEVLLLLQQLRSHPNAPKILCVDTTNTGNAVNKALKAIRGVCDQFPQETEVNVIGIVDGAKAVPTGKDQIAIEYAEGSIAHVSRRREILFPTCVNNYCFSELHWIPKTNSSRFFASYWVLDHLFTEDEAALVGATSIHEQLVVGTDSSAGRLLITFDNGMRMPLASAGTVGRQLSSLLNLRDDHPVWRQFDEQSRIPSQDLNHEANFEDVRAEVLQSLEIDEDPSAIVGILGKRTGLLTAAEIRALADARQFDAQPRGMVQAALTKTFPDSLVHEAAQLYFQVLEQFSYDCCHEAGHATARYLNGDTLLSISVDHPEDISFRPHIGERGSVLFRHRQYQCGCGGFVRDGIQENESEFRFTPGCLSCEAYLTSCLTAIFAGRSATQLLSPQNHQDHDSGFDNEASNVILKNAIEPIHREMVIRNAQRLASEMVYRHSALIMRVKDALFSAYGFLDGEKVTELLSELTQHA